MYKKIEKQNILIYYKYILPSNFFCEKMSNSFEDIIFQLKEEYFPLNDYYDFKNKLHIYFGNMWKIEGRETRGMITFIFCLIQYARKKFPYQSETKPQNFIKDFLYDFGKRKFTKIEENIIYIISDIFKRTYKKESEDFYDWIEKNFVYTQDDYYERLNDPAQTYNLQERQPTLLKELVKVFGPEILI